MTVFAGLAGGGGLADGVGWEVGEGCTNTLIIIIVKYVKIC